MNPPKHPYAERARLLHEYGISLETREIWFEGDFETESAAAFNRNMRLLESLGDGPIFLHVCSPGGDYNSGMAVYDAIKWSPCWVIYLAHGLAASMSTVTPQAADTRIIMPSADVMLHYGHETIMGTAVETRSTSNWYEKLRRQMLFLYAERCKGAPLWKGKSAAQIVGEIDRTLREQSDWYMTAHQSVDYGFFDSVLDCPVQSLLE